MWHGDAGSDPERFGGSTDARAMPRQHTGTPFKGSVHDARRGNGSRLPAIMAQLWRKAAASVFVTASY